MSLIHHVGTVSSTNDIALQMARDGACEGAVIIAEQQTAGRGRRGRLWQDEPGQSILMSVILRPELPVTELSGLSFVASLAAAQFLASDCRLEAQLKWPNDIYIGERKFGGILIETSAGAAIVGIGININQRAFPGELEEIATSVMLESGQSFNTSMLAESLAAGIMGNYREFLELGLTPILCRWREHMWGIGASVHIETENTSLTGVIQGVDTTGALLVLDLDGAMHSIHAVDTIKTTTN